MLAANLNATGRDAEAAILGGLLDRLAEKHRSLVRKPNGCELLGQLLNGSTQEQMENRRRVNEWLGKAPSSFWAAALHLLRTERNRSMRDRLLGLLPGAEALLTPLQDPTIFDRDDAVDLTSELSRLRPMLDVRLLQQALDSAAEWNDPTIASKLQRTLELVEAITDGERIRPLLVKMQRINNPRVQSKIALLLARNTDNSDRVERKLEEPDPRTRANAVEGLWDATPSEDNRQLLWKATKDPHHRTVCNALVGLARMREVKALEKIEELTEHSSPEFRVAAVWAMGEVGDPRFRNRLRQIAQNEQGAVRRNALRALVRLQKPTSAKLSAKAPAPQPTEPAGDVDYDDVESPLILA